MSDICGRRRLAKLAFVTGASGNLRGFLKEVKDIDGPRDFRLTDPFAFHAAFLQDPFEIDDASAFLESRGDADTKLFVEKWVSVRERTHGISIGQGSGGLEENFAALMSLKEELGTLVSRYESSVSQSLLHSAQLAGVKALRLKAEALLGAKAKDGEPELRSKVEGLLTIERTKPIVQTLEELRSEKTRLLESLGQNLGEKAIASLVQNLGEEAKAVWENIEAAAAQLVNEVRGVANEEKYLVAKFERLAHFQKKFGLLLKQPPQSGVYANLQKQFLERDVGEPGTTLLAVLHLQGVQELLAVATTMLGEKAVEAEKEAGAEGIVKALGVKKLMAVPPKRESIVKGLAELRVEEKRLKVQDTSLAQKAKEAEEQPVGERKKELQEFVAKAKEEIEYGEAQLENCPPRILFRLFCIWKQRYC